MAFNKRSILVNAASKEEAIRKANKKVKGDFRGRKATKLRAGVWCVVFI